MQIQEEWGEVPPNWGVYFVVDDADATMKQAQELGATPMMGPIDVAGVGRIYPLQDPQGAYLSIIQMAGVGGRRSSLVRFVGEDKNG